MYNYKSLALKTLQDTVLNLKLNKIECIVFARNFPVFIYINRISLKRDTLETSTKGTILLPTIKSKVT